VHVRRLIEDNKEDEELVEIDPKWGITTYILCCEFFVLFGCSFVHLIHFLV
jgi:hypothetical protein